MKHGVPRCHFLPDGTLLAVAVGIVPPEVSLWDVTSRERVAALQPRGWDFRSLSFSADGTLLAVGAGGGGEASIWNVATRQQVASFQPGIAVYSLSLSPDGTLLVTSEAHDNMFKVSLWDVASRERVATLQPGHRHHIPEVSFSSDGTLLAFGPRRGEVSIWNVATRQQVASFQPGNAVSSLSLSPDGTLLAIGTNGPVLLWDVASRQLVATFVHLGEVFEVSFSPDGTLLATGGRDGTVQLWDVSEWTGEGTITTVEQAMPHTLTKVSGDGQEGTTSEPLAKPFVVSVLDQNGSPLAGAVVRFAVTAGGGTLSSTTATTDANGRAIRQADAGL